MFLAGCIGRHGGDSSSSQTRSNIKYSSVKKKQVKEVILLPLKKPCNQPLAWQRLSSLSISSLYYHW